MPADIANTVIFGLAALLVVASALMVVLNRHPVHSALFLVLTFLGLSVFFLQLRAPFLAAVQVIIYAGAIMVLFVFVIMLLGEDSPMAGERKMGAQLPLGALFALVLVSLLGYSLLRGPSDAAGQAAFAMAPGEPPRVQVIGTTGEEGKASFGSVKAIGNTLFTQYLFAFEATSVVLLVAMIGVVVLAKRKL